jgi:hypothetical protein
MANFERLVYALYAGPKMPELINKLAAIHSLRNWTYNIDQAKRVIRVSFAIKHRRTDQAFIGMGIAEA